MSLEDIHQLTHIDYWFLDNLQEIVELEDTLRARASLDEIDDALLLRAKQTGFFRPAVGDHLWHQRRRCPRQPEAPRIVASFKSVDTCAAEFEAYTPYYYSTYEQEDETPPKQRGAKRIVVLGGGPNRIGQGIEFDYCCCHASYALRELGIESIMVNSNPERSAPITTPAICCSSSRSRPKTC